MSLRNSVIVTDNQLVPQISPQPHETSNLGNQSHHAQIAEKQSIQHSGKWKRESRAQINVFDIVSGDAHFNHSGLVRSDF